MQPYILGVDIGTGSTKSIAVNITGEAFSEKKFHYPTNYPFQGFVEQDPELIWKAFTESIIQQIEELKQAPVAICLSSAMHSVIPVDDKGNALGALITWADGRSADIAERIKGSATAEEIYKYTGTPIHAMSPLCKIIWLKENNKDLFQKANKFISIKEYIWFKLFAEFKVDISIASATGLLDIETNQWYKPSFDLAGISEGKVSIPVSPAYNKTVSNTSILKLLHLPANVPFIIGGSDGCMANVGSFTTKAHQAAVTIGTSGAVRITSTLPSYNYKAMTFNYRLDEETFISGGAINNGGNVLQWFVKNILQKEDLTGEDYDHFFNEVDKVQAGSEGVMFLPYLNGERAPMWDTKTSGTFMGIRPNHTTAHFSRAVIEGICYAINDVLLTLEKAGEEITILNVSGGFITSTTWMQVMADITGKQIQLTQTEDASAIGAAYFGMKSLGLIKSYDELVASHKIEQITPDVNKHNIYLNYFPIFKSLYSILKEPMHQLYNLNLP